MTISEVIAALEQLQDELGDVDVENTRGALVEVEGSVKDGHTVVVIK